MQVSGPRFFRWLNIITIGFRWAFRDIRTNGAKPTIHRHEWCVITGGNADEFVVGTHTYRHGSFPVSGTFVTGSTGIGCDWRDRRRTACSADTDSWPRSSASDERNPCSPRTWWRRSERPTTCRRTLCTVWSRFELYEWRREEQMETHTQISGSFVCMWDISWNSNHYLWVSSIWMHRINTKLCIFSELSDCDAVTLKLYTKFPPRYAKTLIGSHVMRTAHVCAKMFDSRAQTFTHTCKRSNGHTSASINTHSRRNTDTAIQNNCEPDLLQHIFYW